MPGMSLGGDLEESLCETVKLKPGLPQRPQDIGGTTAMEYLPRKAVRGSGTNPRERGSVAVSKAERSWSSEERFNIRQGDAV